MLLASVFVKQDQAKPSWSAIAFELFSCSILLSLALHHSFLFVKLLLVTCLLYPPSPSTTDRGMSMPQMFLPPASSCLEFRRSLVAGRREFLRAGCLSLCGLGLADLLAASAARGASGERTLSGGRAQAHRYACAWYSH
jgi:hypothetical protein